MQTLFVQVLNMSITASCVIPVVLLTRCLLRRAPKGYSYLLWSAVLYRLICPASFSSAISLFGLKPFQMAEAQPGGGILSYVPANIGRMQTPQIATGIPAVRVAIGEGLPQAIPPAGVNPLQQGIALAAGIWCAGIAILLLHNLVCYLRLQRRVATAVQLAGNVFESDSIRSPFVFGWLRPRILIPFGLSDQERTCILRHERFHLQRKDHLIKPLAYALLMVHWFNPLVWLSFALMGQDMEMSCDELVLLEAGTSTARRYGTLLLSLATKRWFSAVSPLAFGETGIRSRMINILRFRRPPRWASASAAIACVLTVAVCVANPLQHNPGYELIGGTLIADVNSIKAAYQRFEGMYRQEITLSPGITRFFVTTSTMMRITVEDKAGHQLGSSPPMDSSVAMIEALGGGFSDTMEVAVKTPGTYVVVVQGTDSSGSFGVSWGQPKYVSPSP